MRTAAVIAIAVLAAACGGGRDGTAYATPQEAAEAAGVKCTHWNDIDRDDTEDSDFPDNPPPQAAAEASCVSSGERLQTSFLLFDDAADAEAMVAWLEQAYGTLPLEGDVVATHGERLVTLTLESVWEDDTRAPQGPDARELTERIADALDLEVVTIDLAR